MTEYFVVMNSFAAPICSDTIEMFIKAKTPADAMAKAVKEFDHPFGLYAANLYENADAYHKNKKPLATWRSKECKENSK